MDTTAARWRPDSGIFAPTTGFDPRLFDEHHELRPEVAQAIMSRLDQALRSQARLLTRDWQKYLRVYLAGGSASEWAGGRPNDTAEDLDVLIGVRYGAYRRATGSQLLDPAIDTELNSALREHFNDPTWAAPFGGTWAVTGYVNPNAWDIRVIKPYAAWDITRMSWAVRPPHLPGHTLADFSPAVLSMARAVAAQARAILRMDEPLRTREARALWESLHADRRAAFSDLGEGWQDAGNVVEKWLAYAPGDLLGKIRDLALAKTAAGSNGDRFVTCQEGHEHWGAHGAAGMLIRHQPEDGDRLFLLQRRGPDVDHPGKWSIPSGAIGKDETPEQGAQREYREEAGAIPRGVRHSHTVKSTDCGDWAFHTVVADSPERFLPRGRGETEHEVGGYGWYTAREIGRMKGRDELHPAFAKSWDWVRDSKAPKTGAREKPTKDKRQVNYRHPTSGSEHCGNCTMFRLNPPDFDPETGACTLVEGLIDEEAVCDEWYPKGKIAVTGYTDLTSRSAHIYLPIPEGAIRRVPGGVDDEPHITIVYLGKSVNDTDFAKAVLRAQVAAQKTPPLSGVLQGVETFPPEDGSDGKRPAFVPAYVPGINRLRELLEDLSRSKHKDYRPHVTLAYLEEGDEVPPPHPPVPVHFTHLHVKRGDDVVRFPLGNS